MGDYTMAEKTSPEPPTAKGNNKVNSQVQFIPLDEGTVAEFNARVERRVDARLRQMKRWVKGPSREVLGDVVDV